MKDLDLKTYRALGKPLSSQVLSCCICKSKVKSAYPSFRDYQGAVMKTAYRARFLRSMKASLARRGGRKGLPSCTHSSDLFNSKNTIKVYGIFLMVSSGYNLKA